MKTYTDGTPQTSSLQTIKYSISNHILIYIKLCQPGLPVIPTHLTTLFTSSYKTSLKYNWKHESCFNLCPPLHQWKSKTPLTSEAFDFIYSSVTENMA